MSVLNDLWHDEKPLMLPHSIMLMLYLDVLDLDYIIADMAKLLKSDLFKELKRGLLLLINTSNENVV